METGAGIILSFDKSDGDSFLQESIVNGSKIVIETIIGRLFLVLNIFLNFKLGQDVNLI
jgi:hypothetical protein